MERGMFIPTLNCCSGILLIGKFRIHSVFVWTRHTRGSRIFGGWGPGSMARKQPGQRFSFVFFSFSPQLILQLTERSNGFIKEKTIPFQANNFQ